MAPPPYGVSWIDNQPAGDGAGEGGPDVQLRGDEQRPADAVHQAARKGIAETGSPLPHLDVIQRAFGRHDVSEVKAHVGGAATEASAAIGAEAYATGDHVAFASTPDLHTAAHEAAHVVQQRAGVQLPNNVGQADDAYEQHADAVADRVVSGGSAEALLDSTSGQSNGSAGVQRKAAVMAPVQAAWGSWGNSSSSKTSQTSQTSGGWGSWGSSKSAASSTSRGGASSRAQLDQTIAQSGNVGAVISAFQSYWGVRVKSKSGTSWNAATLRQIHRQLKRLPGAHVRRGLWKSLTLGKHQGGFWDESGGDIEVGNDLASVDWATFGRGTTVATEASAGDQTIQISDGSLFGVGETIRIGPTKTYRIAKKRGATLTLDRPLSDKCPAKTKVTAADKTAQHTIDWVDATIRHEMGHAMDTAIGGANGFYALGGWQTHDVSTSGFNKWVSAMGGNAWRAKDGTELTRDEQNQARDAILEAVDNELTDLRNDESNKRRASSHPIIRFWNRGVPVIEAAHASLSEGMYFFMKPKEIPSIGGKRFTVNTTYNEFQYCDEQVYSHRVSDYSTFSPGEFFAEVYTAYYEDAGKPGGARPGQRVPVAKWRTWIASNVDTPGATKAKKSGFSWGKPAVGIKAGKSGS